MVVARCSTRWMLVVAVVAACAWSDNHARADTSSGPSPIIGGSLAPADDAVVMLNIGCTGTLIAPNVVLTAAHCIPSSGVQFGVSQDTLFASRDAVEEIVARSYRTGLFDGGDIALIRLSSDAPAGIEPIPLHRAPITDDDIGRAIRLVGYGIDAAGVFGTRRQITVAIGGYSDRLITVGEANNTSCYGDSGGPAFLDVDGTEQVAGVTSFGAGGCTSSAEYTRVDVYLAQLIDEVVDAWSGPCRADGVCDDQLACPGFPDPDCDPCGFQGVCATGCADKDLDCPIGGFDGASCNDREDCESLFCIEAPEDPRVKFCSEPCDEQNGSYCTGVLNECTAAAGPTGENACTFAGYTPGVQGAQCLTGSECRSTVCDPDAHICIEQCASDADCPAEFTCRSIGSQSACRYPAEGGCQASDRSSTLLVILALLAAVTLARRRAR